MNIIFVISSILVATSILILLIVFKLREKYLIVWSALSLLTLIFGILFEPLDQFARILGFRVYSNFVFLFFGLCIGILIFQLSLNLSRQEDKIQTLCEEISILKLKTKNFEL